MLHKLSFLAVLLSLSVFSFFSYAESTPEASVSVLFSPSDECGRIISEKIDGAEKTIELAIYMLTSRSLAKSLVLAVRRGVAVRIFADGESSREYYSKVNFLKKNGVLVKIEDGKGLMHNKFCVIDDKTLITGSYNWTNSADLMNDENVVIIESEKIARVFRVQFEKYWQGTYTDEAFYIDKNKLIKHK